MARSCLLLLAALAVQARADPLQRTRGSATSNDLQAPLYPEAVILVPSNETAAAGQKPVVLMVPELKGLVPGLNESDPAYNDLRDVVTSERAGAVLLVASLDPAGATNTTSSDPSANNSSGLEDSSVEKEFIRKRRSPGAELDPLVRKKRTHYGQPNPCMICGMMPQTKQIIINIPILKKPKKKKHPSYYPPPCGYPQCGGQPQYHPPPPPPPCGYPQCGQPQYHPPPPPPPPPQHYPQTCNVCQGGGGYPPSSGSYSHSSSQSSSSSYSGGWGKK